MLLSSVLLVVRRVVVLGVGLELVEKRFGWGEKPPLEVCLRRRSEARLLGSGGLW